VSDDVRVTAEPPGAPSIPGWIVRTNTRSADAWQVMWDAMKDGEWHRGLDLTYAVDRTGLDMSSSSLMIILAKATRAGLLETERRPAAPALGRPNAPKVSGHRVWYRRPQ